MPIARLRLLRFASVGALAAAAVAPALAADDINAGSLTNSPPLISYAADGTTLQGMIVDLAAAMSQKMGRTIVFRPMAFPAIIPGLEAKSIDIAFTVMNDTPEREQVIDFVDYFNFGTMLLVKKGNPEQVASLETACGKTVSTVQGSTQIKLAEGMSEVCVKSGKAAITVMQYAQPADARLQVQTGRVAAFLGNSPVMVYLAKTAGDGTVFDVVADHEYQPVPVGIGVPKSNPKLRDQLKNALDALIADGSYTKILQKHGLQGGAVMSAVINGGKNVKY
ncbi:MAG TPA: ABC transporter substrate-binding protein [Caldimonas sp.]|jgi:polar amino acid transport system substrate-binding protein|nr:ABC transporter substrate-binding protein [Caldimonas sp.]HEX4233778.1 ABC transporter substrate-binding protein [Caldimonas sp.]